MAALGAGENDRERRSVGTAGILDGYAESLNGEASGGLGEDDRCVTGAVGGEGPGGQGFLAAGLQNPKLVSFAGRQGMQVRCGQEEPATTALVNHAAFRRGRGNRCWMERYPLDMS